MAANPFVAIINYRTASGKTGSVSLTVSDVAAAFALWPSAESVNPLSAEPCIITDFLTTESGTDTTHFETFVNGINTGRDIYYGANVMTLQVRDVMRSPIGLKAGATLKLVQRA